MAVQHPDQQAGAAAAKTGAVVQPPPGLEDPLHRRVRQRVVPPLLAVLTVVVLWVLLSRIAQLVPGPLVTLSEAWRLLTEGEFFFHMWESLRRVLVGFAAAMFLSLLIGILMGTSTAGERYFGPMVVIGLTVPGLIWALISVMIFGLSELTAYFAVTVTIFPMLVITIWGAVKSMDRDLIDMSTVLRLSVGTKIRAVILPQLVPSIFSATRYGLGLAWKIVVVVELFGASTGIGYQINRAYQLFSLELVLAWTALFVVVMLGIEHLIVNPLERRLTAWRPEVNVWRR